MLFLVIDSCSFGGKQWDLRQTCLRLPGKGESCRNLFLWYSYCSHYFLNVVTFFSAMLGLIVNTMRRVKRKGGKNPALWWKCQEIALMLAPPESSHPSKWYTKHRCCLNWFEWTILLSVAGILTDKYYVLYSFFFGFFRGLEKHLGWFWPGHSNIDWKSKGWEPKPHKRTKFIPGWKAQV